MITTLKRPLKMCPQKSFKLFKDSPHPRCIRKMKTNINKCELTNLTYLLITPKPKLISNLTIIFGHAYDIWVKYQHLYIRHNFRISRCWISRWVISNTLISDWRLFSMISTKYHFDIQGRYPKNPNIHPTLVQTPLWTCCD